MQRFRHSFIRTLAERGSVSNQTSNLGTSVSDLGMLIELCPKIYASNYTYDYTLLSD